MFVSNLAAIGWVDFSRFFIVQLYPYLSLFQMSNQGQGFALGPERVVWEKSGKKGVTLICCLRVPKFVAMAVINNEHEVERTHFPLVQQKTLLYISSMSGNATYTNLFLYPTVFSSFLGKATAAASYSYLKVLNG